jgi:RNA polymerase sigma-70 factor (ECF subfamily)
MRLQSTNSVNEADALACEAQAIHRAAAGDPQAFEYLYRRHERRIYALCFRLIRNSDLAEDFVQDTFLQAFRHIATFRGSSKFSTWLSRIAINVVFTKMRRAKSRIAEISVDSFEDDQQKEQSNSSMLERFPARTGNSLDFIQLERAIAALPAGYKTVFILHHVEGYGSQEIASMLGFTLNNTKTKLHRARMMLRKQLLKPARQREQAVIHLEPSLAIYAGRSISHSRSATAI